MLRYTTTYVAKRIICNVIKLEDFADEKISIALQLTARELEMEKVLKKHLHMLESGIPKEESNIERSFRFFTKRF